LFRDVASCISGKEKMGSDVTKCRRNNFENCGYVSGVLGFGSTSELIL
jgi:hypothetical protein